ncbi:hypothetical protein R3P38DRAFT_2811694 [Favolaschia claudopus]|uniref:Uncharacterized protein n=1 Tax=Favolaschia claudopus TaxID=2862362 RepID=A0AAV9Z966_9AGAR
MVIASGERLFVLQPALLKPKSMHQEKPKLIDPSDPCLGFGRSFCLDKVDEDGKDEEIKEEPLTGSDSEVGEDIVASSEDSEIDSTHELRSSHSADWDDYAQEFIIPRTRVKKEYRWSISKKLDTEYKFLPTWFDLSDDEDQFGPIPAEWLKEAGGELQDAIYESFSEGDRRTMNCANSMAVIVEVPQVQRKRYRHQRTGFTKYLREIHVNADKQEGASKKARAKKSSKAEG